MSLFLANRRFCMAEVKKADWRSLCQGDDGSYYDREETEYEFSNGRKFKKKTKPFYTEEDN